MDRPTLDLFYIARVPDFNDVVIQPSEVMEFMICPLQDVPLADFAFESNSEAIRRLRAHQTSSRFFDEVDETLDGFTFGDVELHGSLADVEIDLVRTNSSTRSCGTPAFGGF